MYNLLTEKYVHILSVGTCLSILFSIYLHVYIYIYILDIDLGVRVFTNRPGDLGSIPGRVIPKTQKMVLDASLLNIQHYKVWIKGKIEQSREGVAPSPTPWCSSYRKVSLRVTLDYGRQLYFYLYIYIYIYMLCLNSSEVIPLYQAVYSTVDWSCKVHQLHLCKGGRSPKMSVLDMILNNLMVRLLSLPLLPGLLWPGVVDLDWVPSMGQIEQFDI